MRASKCDLSVCKACTRLLFSIWQFKSHAFSFFPCCSSYSSVYEDEPSRLSKDLSGAVVSLSSVVSLNWFCFLSPSQAQSKEWKGTLQRESTCVAAVFPASPVNSTDDRLSALMDDMFSLPPSSPFLFGTLEHLWSFYFWLFTAEDVDPPSVYIKFETYSTQLHEPHRALVNTASLQTWFKRTNVPFMK